MRISDWSSDVCSSDLPERNETENERRSKTGKIADLTGAEAEATVERVALGVRIGDRRHAQRASVGRQVEAVGQQGHRARHIACDDLAQHHHRRKRDDPQGAPRSLVIRRAQEDVIVLESVDVARPCHGWLYFTYRRMTVISSSAPFFRSASDRPGLATCSSR